jgi:hypothetical protein
MLRFNIFQLTNDLDKLYASLLRKRGYVIEVVRGKMTALMYQLAAKIVTEKLSGRPLGRRTGILAGSVRVIPAQYVSAKKIVAAVEAAAPPAGYGVIQERGVPSPYAIMASSAKVLSWVKDGHRLYAQSVIHPPMMGAQRWFSSTEAANEEWIREELRAALNQAMEE